MELLADGGGLRAAIIVDGVELSTVIIEFIDIMEVVLASGSNMLAGPRPR